MDKKLTLSLNAAVVEQAKSYAKEHGISLSRMVENYLSTLTDAEKRYSAEDFPVSPLVNRLVGVIELEVNEDESLEAGYSNYLMEKYL